MSSSINFMKMTIIFTGFFVCFFFFLMASKNNSKNPNLLFSYINPIVLRGSRLTTKIGFSSEVLGKCCANLPGSRTKRRPSYISSWFEEIILVCLYTSSWNTVALCEKNPKGQHKWEKKKDEVFLNDGVQHPLPSGISDHDQSIDITVYKLKIPHKLSIQQSILKYFYVWIPIWICTIYRFLNT